MQIHETQISDVGKFEIFAVLIFSLIYSAFCFLKLIKSIRAFLDLNVELKKARLPSPPFITKFSAYAVAIWGGLAIGGCWIFWLCLYGGVLSYNEISVGPTGVKLTYSIEHRQNNLDRVEIERVELVDVGRKTAILRISTKDGQTFHSARADAGLLTDVELWINNYLMSSNSLSVH